MFASFETENFPVEVCTAQNLREKEVKDAPDGVTYLCVVVDKRWPNQCRLEHLRPYIARDSEGTLLYGWACIDSDGYVDHITRPIHYDYERVVAWKRVESPVKFMPEAWPEE